MSKFLLHDLGRFSALLIDLSLTLTHPCDSRIDSQLILAESPALQRLAAFCSIFLSPPPPWISRQDPARLPQTTAATGCQDIVARPAPRSLHFTSHHASHSAFTRAATHRDPWQARLHGWPSCPPRPWLARPGPAGPTRTPFCTRRSLCTLDISARSRTLGLPRRALTLSLCPLSCSPLPRLTRGSGPVAARPAPAACSRTPCT
jgi:hypothetical protein